MPALGLAFFIWVVAMSGCSGKSSAALYLEGAQGTAQWHVTVSDPKGNSPETLQAGIEVVLARVNGQIGSWDAASEISRFNQYQGTDWFPVSADLAGLVSQTLKVSEESGGVYDVTVGPLIKLWGFRGGEPAKDRVPGKAEIDAARAKVGFHKLQVRAEPPALRKSQADAVVELASVADGFAADQVGHYLESLGIQHYMAEVAGEIRTRGISPRGDKWQIAIEKPLDLGRAVQQGISLDNSGLATSGDYRNFFTENGRRYSHTIDPTTGEPEAYNLASVSVLAPEATMADAYATLLMALGEVKGRAFAEQHGITAYFIWRTDAGFEVYATAGFRQDFSEGGK
jgi:thiamine biosynthesis lipoprotein